MFQSNEYKFSNPSIKSSKSNISAIMTIFNQIKIRYEYLLGVVYGCKYECAGIWIFVLQKVIHIPLALLLLFYDMNMWKISYTNTDVQIMENYSYAPF